MSLFGKGTYSSRTPLQMIPACGVCKLYKKCKSPKIPLYGKGREGILVVGEAPGENEDEQNKPFVGVAGKFLREELRRLDVDLKGDCWVTNSLICRPPGNRTPTDKEVEYCRPNLLKIIDETKPRVILLLGGTAVRSLIGFLWREDPGGVTKWSGMRIPCHRYDAWVCPTFHPSHLLRKEQSHEVLKLYFRKHLEGAVSLKKRPWGGEPPNYPRQVIVCHDHQKAGTFLRQFRERDHKVPLAFDYETDRLKPDHEQSKILCCAVSDGSTSIAFPWVGEGAKEWVNIMKSSHPKIAQNFKFESRWTRRVLGFWPQNIIWDTMLASHVLDNRREVTGLKFQAFVRLGQEPDEYDRAVAPFMKAGGSNLPNRLKEFDRGKLLKYCGLDALLTHKIYQMQRKEMEG